ncbi:MAG: T9SS type A sorting domain-containing protein [Saprospiraceae bacterium]|nr:T9SS type A sorting domain-containing protein [Saprospiraceae bacterium]
MKRLLSLLVACAVAPALFAQNPPPCTTQGGLGVVNANDLSASLYSNGRFLDGLGLKSIDPNTQYGARLWLAGIDPGGNLKLTTPTYSNIGLHSGPLTLTGAQADDCLRWNRVFAVKGPDVIRFLDTLPNLTPQLLIDRFPSIAGWPAVGNPYYESVYGYPLPATASALAPFYDADSDGLYDPMQGDYPVVRLKNKPLFVPEEIHWMVYNDVDVLLGVRAEYQLTTWAFKCPNVSPLNRTIFTSHKVYYKNVERLDSVFTALWTDFDIGCYADDFIGSLPERNSFFAYNQDPVDGPGSGCNVLSTFPDSVPVPAQSTTFLGSKMDHMGYAINNSAFYPPAMGDPISPVEFYNVINGRWRDGTPLTVGGAGYNPGNPGAPTAFAFPGDPNNPAAWTMCSASIAGGDIRGLGIRALGSLAPGQIVETTAAWTYHTQTNLPCNLGSMISEIDAVIAAYNNGFTNACAPLVVGTKDIAAPAHFDVFPNPANNVFTVRHNETIPVSVRVWDPLGRLVYFNADLPAGQFDVQTAQWAPGLYRLQLQTADGYGVKNVVIAR